MPIPDGAIDLSVDGHVLSGFGHGRVAINELVMAGERAGLTGLTFGDPVGPESGWLRAYLDAIRRARSRTGLTLRAAIEVPVVGPDGWVAFPDDLGGLDAVCLVLPSLPSGSLSGGSGGSGSGPARVRELVHSGALSAAAVWEIAVEVTARGLERASRYAPTQLARPLRLLTDAGLADAWRADAGPADPGLADVAGRAMRDLVAACRATGAVVEVSEAWRCPSAALADQLAAAGVAMVAASDSPDPAQVGRFRYARALLHPTEPADCAPDCNRSGPERALHAADRTRHDRGDRR